MKKSPFIRLIGIWQTTGKVLQSENSAEVALKGIDSYELILNGHFILHKADVLMGSEKSETLELIELEGQEPKAKMKYYNSNGENGVMIGMISGNDFNIDGDVLKFRGKLNNDNTLIVGKWFMKSGNGEWKDFIELELKKSK
jgi:hypothetical protein